MPEFVVIRGEMTFTICAMQAILTSLLFLTYPLSSLDTSLSRIAESYNSTHENIQPYSHRQSVKESIRLFGAFAANRPRRKPNVPFVEADRGPRLVPRYLFLHSRKIDETACNFDSSFCGERRRGILKVVVASSVQLYTMHIHQRRSVFSQVT